MLKWSQYWIDLKASLWLTPTLIIIAAVALAGASFTGGRGSIIGAILAAATLGLLGSLLFFVAEPPYWAWVFIGSGLVVCAVATLAPLSRRKRVEYQVQREPVATTTTEIAILDPLDKAGKREERHA